MYWKFNSPHRFDKQCLQRKKGKRKKKYPLQCLEKLQSTLPAQHKTRAPPQDERSPVCEGISSTRNIAAHLGWNSAAAVLYNTSASYNVAAISTGEGGDEKSSKNNRKCSLILTFASILPQTNITAASKNMLPPSSVQSDILVNHFLAPVPSIFWTWQQVAAKSSTCT